MVYRHRYPLLYTTSLLQRFTLRDLFLTYFEGRNREEHVERGLLDTEGEREGRTSWESNVEIYTVSAQHAHLCLILCHPTFCSPPGSSVLGIFQAKIPCVK